MIRLIVRIDDATMAANVGGSPQTTFRTFDVEHSELEALLSGGGSNSQNEFSYRTLVGAEVSALRALQTAPAKLDDETRQVLSDLDAAWSSKPRQSFGIHKDYPKWEREVYGPAVRAARELLERRS